MLRWLRCHLLRRHCEHVAEGGVAVKLSIRSGCKHHERIYGFRYECCGCGHANYYRTLARGPRIFNYRVK